MVAHGESHMRGTSIWYNVVRHYTRRNEEECALVAHGESHMRGTSIWLMSSDIIRARTKRSAMETEQHNVTGSFTEDV